MAMNVSNDYTNAAVYNAPSATAEEKKEDTAAAAKTESRDNEAAAVYEKSAESDKKATYSINKMNAADRENIVNQLKADQESRKQSLVNLVNSMLGKQAGAYATASGGNSIWRKLAGGKCKADPASIAQAQKDIADDGYWGVKQTSQRLFDFASALAGDDVEKMKEMQSAMEKGFQKAAKTWGGSLPGICHETMSAANKLFEDYYSSKE